MVYYGVLPMVGSQLGSFSTSCDPSVHCNPGTLPEAAARPAPLDSRCFWPSVAVVKRC